MRVAIVEDSVLLREGVAQLLTDADIEVTARCGTADELLARVAVDPPDAVIVDIRLPPTHTDEGMRAALIIRQQHPDVGVLVLSQYVEVGLAMQLLADSAEGAGYLLKDRVSEVRVSTTCCGFGVKPLASSGCSKACSAGVPSATKNASATKVEASAMVGSLRVMCDSIATFAGLATLGTKLVCG